MQEYDHHIFICLGKRCSKKGAEDLLDAFKGFIKKSGMQGLYRVSRSGCLKACKETRAEGEYSPIVVIYPQGTWYGKVTKGDVSEIVDSLKVGGEPVERLLLHRNF